MLARLVPLFAFMICIGIMILNGVLYFTSGHHWYSIAAAVWSLAMSVICLVTYNAVMRWR